MRVAIALGNRELRYYASAQPIVGGASHVGQNQTAAQKIRASLKHPVVDADGHWLEFPPVIIDQLKKIGGDTAVNGFLSFNKGVAKALAATPEQRKAMRRAQEAFWAVPTRNTLDRATELMPKLLYERLDEFGIDFTVLYPTSGARRAVSSR